MGRVFYCTTYTLPIDKARVLTLKIAPKKALWLPGFHVGFRADSVMFFHVVSCRVYVWDAWCIENHCFENGKTPQVSLRSRPWRGLSLVRCFMSGWGFVSGLRVPKITHNQECQPHSQKREDGAQKKKKTKTKTENNSQKRERLATDWKAKEATKIKRRHPTIQHVHKKSKKHNNKNSNKNQYHNNKYNNHHKYRKHKKI